MKHIENIPEDSDIFCIIGYTGSGKSILTHYLSGSEIGKSDLGTFIVKEIQKNSLGVQNVEVSSSTISETQFVTTVQVDLSLLDDFSSGKVLLLDTPGLLDNRSPEIELSNQKGMIETMKRCESLRPIFLFRDKDKGSRSDKLFDMLKWIADTFKSLRDD